MVAHKQVCNSAQWLCQTLPAQVCVFDIPLEVFVSSLTVLPRELKTGPLDAAFGKLCLAQVSIHAQLTLAASSSPALPAGLGFVTATWVWQPKEAKCAVMDSFLYQCKFCSVLVLLLRGEEHASSVFLAMLVIIRQHHPIMGCYIAIQN